MTKHHRAFSLKTQNLPIPTRAQPGNTLPQQPLGRGTVAKDLLFSFTQKNKRHKEQMGYLSLWQKAPEAEKQRWGDTWPGDRGHRGHRHQLMEVVVHWGYCAFFGQPCFRV